MNYWLSIISISALLISLPTSANCIQNLQGKVLCGEGKCEMDTYGKVYCAPAGGGAMQDKYGKIRCGVGRCAKDYLEQIWCSKEPDGGAALDSYQKVKCLGGCEPASEKLCREGQEAK